jgi:hypothetical protein
MTQEKVLLTVGNIAPRLAIVGTGERIYVGIVNRKAYEQGVTVYAALGGAVEVTARGRQELEKMCGVQFISGSDARMICPAEAVPSIEQFFAERNPLNYELTPDREIREELGSCEIPGQLESLLSSELLLECTSVYVRSLEQPQNGRFVSTRSPGLPSVRYFNVFELAVTPRVYEALRRSEFIAFFTEEDVARTNGRMQAVPLGSGRFLGSNIFVF